jgi:hypothetical protein
MRFAKGLKVRRAILLSGSLWAVPLILAVIITISPGPYPGSNPLYLGLGGIPWLLLIAVGGCAVLAAALWLLLFIADTLRHAIARR